MSVVSTDTTCGVRLSNSDWPAAFVAYKAGKEANGVRMSYELWQVEYELWIAGQSASGAPIQLTATAGDTLTSSRLVGILVGSIGMDRALINEYEGDGLQFRKGSDGDTEDEQRASDTLTLLTGTFYDDQLVTIFLKS
jgi:hypothetical protein